MLQSMALIRNYKMIENTIEKFLKDITNSATVQSIIAKYRSYREVIANYIESLNLPPQVMVHAHNACAIFVSYLVISILIYPKCSFWIFLREIFALMSAYVAVCFWIRKKISEELPYKIAIYVTSCAAPMIFINNSFMIAIVGIFVLIFMEFLLFQKLKVPNLFSRSTPAYIVCSDKIDDVTIAVLQKKYKILEIINVNSARINSENGNQPLVFEDLYSWLKKISQNPFYPFPRKIIYISSNCDPFILSKILFISSEFSIHVLKSINAQKHHKLESNTGVVTPVSFNDFDFFNPISSEKASLITLFKGKKIWIQYDGRACVLELIKIISSINSAELTIICSAEQLMAKAELELANANSTRNYKIKITDINLMLSEDSKPDMLFYSLPIKSFAAGSDNLKEAVIKNVIETQNLVSSAQASKIPFVFVLSNNSALNASGWVGATQRLGELLTQFSDLQNRKANMRFFTIRMPDCVTDPLGVFDRIASSVVDSGSANVNMHDAEIERAYYKRDIMPLLIKCILMATKDTDTSAVVYTLLPKAKIEINEVLSIICSMFSLKKDVDVNVVNACASEFIELDDFPNIDENIEQTSIESIFITKLSIISPQSYTNNINLKEVNSMSTRDLISLVFSRLKEKIK